MSYNPDLDGIYGPMDEDRPFGYEVGYIVRFNGAKGVIRRISEGPYTLMRDYPIEVEMDTGRILYFTADGKYLKEMDRSCLEVVGKRPVKVKKWNWIFECPATGWRVDHEFLTEEEAKNAFFKLPHQKIEASMEDFYE